jgi:hypothetical protein
MVRRPCDHRLRCGPSRYRSDCRRGLVSAATLNGPVMLRTWQGRLPDGGGYWFGGGAPKRSAGETEPTAKHPNTPVRL